MRGVLTQGHACTPCRRAIARIDRSLPTQLPAVAGSHATSEAKVGVALQHNRDRSRVATDLRIGLWCKPCAQPCAREPLSTHRGQRDGRGGSWKRTPCCSCRSCSQLQPGIVWLRERCKGPLVPSARGPARWMFLTWVDVRTCHRETDAKVDCGLPKQRSVHLQMRMRGGVP